MQRFGDEIAFFWIDARPDAKPACTFAGGAPI
jgi:hypothetical protein